MGDVQHEVLSVLLESLYTRELLSKTTYESANQLEQKLSIAHRRVLRRFLLCGLRGVLSA